MTNGQLYSTTAQTHINISFTY